MSDPTILARTLAGAALAGGGDEAGRTVMRELCSAIGQLGEGVLSALGLGDEEPTADPNEKQQAGMQLVEKLTKKLRGMNDQERQEFVRKYLDRLTGQAAHGATGTPLPHHGTAPLNGHAHPSMPYPGVPPGYAQPQGYPGVPPGYVWTAYGLAPAPGFGGPPQGAMPGMASPHPAPYPMPGYPAPGTDPAAAEQMRQLGQTMSQLATAVAELQNGGGTKKKERRRLFGPAVQTIFVLFLLFNSFFSHLWVPAVERWFYSNWNNLWRSEGISHTLYLQRELADVEKAEALALAEVSRLEKELASPELKGEARIAKQAQREDAGIAFSRLRNTAAALRARLAEYGQTSGYNKTPESLFDEAKGGAGSLPIP